MFCRASPCTFRYRDVALVLYFLNAVTIRLMKLPVIVRAYGHNLFCIVNFRILVLLVRLQDDAWHSFLDFYHLGVHKRYTTETCWFQFPSWHVPASLYTLLVQFFTAVSV